MVEQEPQQLKSELRSLFNYGQRVRQEIAAIDRPAENENQLGKIGDQLDAIVKATEEATNTIMTMMEKNEDEKLLSGPQTEGEGISQDEIDKLFD